MNKRRMLFGFILFSLVIFVACSPASASDTTENNEQASQFRVGILVAGGGSFQPAVDGFIDGMTELGYTEGENITYIYAEEGAELADTATSYVEQDVDLILSVTSTATLVATDTTDTIPIVAAIIPYSVELGLAESLAEPGRNYTGVDIGPVTLQRFQLLIEMFPDVEQVYIPSRAVDATTQVDLQLLRPLAEDLGVELVVEEFTSGEEVESAIDTLPEGIDAIFTPNDVVVASRLLANWSQKAIELGIPHTHASRAHLGPIFTFGPNLYANGFQASNLVHQVLEGTPVGEVPIQIGEFYLTINLQTAEAANLEISDDFLGRANDIIRPDED